MFICLYLIKVTISVIEKRLVLGLLCKNITSLQRVGNNF